MKKLIRPRHLPAIVVFAGLLGFVFQIWVLGGGSNNEGLYKPQPVAWALLWILTTLTLGAIIWLPQKLRSPGRYADHFPASLPGGIGAVLATVSCLISAIGVLQNAANGLSTFTALLGLAATACLGLAAFCRFTGKRPMVLAHTVPCMYFALLIFDRCRNWSNQPQIGLFLFPFLACLCVMLATYQRACFDVDLGKRRSYLFWSLSGVYFCILALPSCDNLLFYGSMAVWLLTNLCNLRPLTRRKPQPEQPPEPTATEADPEPAATEPADKMVAAPASAENMSMDELLDWLNKD